MMFTMDMPTVPMQETPIVLAEAAAPSAGLTPQFDYILTGCKETESTGDPRSAMRAVDPAYLLHNYLAPTYDIDLGAVKTSVLEGTKHGNLVAGISTSGRTAYRYDPIPNYVGNDRAVFMAEFMGKRYKIVVNLVVKLVVDEHPLMDGEKPVCPPPQLIKAPKPAKPSSGASGFGASYVLSSVSVTFAGPSAAASHRTP